MREWKSRRFWSAVSVRPQGHGWQVSLDARLLRTPGKQALVLPTKVLAQAIAAEWDAQADVIDPNRMPLTRAANSAIEKVTPQFQAVAWMLGEYGATDLLSYRAEAPAALVCAQAAGWDPLIDWAASDLAAPLCVTHGVIPVPQPPEARARLHAQVAALDPWGLTALHDLVTLPGSLVLGLAVIRGRIDAATAHKLSRIDEDFQAECWGRDDEAEATAAGRLAAMLDAERFWHLSRT